MIDETDPPPGPEPRLARLWWLLMLPMVASAWVRELWAPDEPRYAEVAREIWDGSSFLVMHLCGEVYPDKPPLLFWLSGLFGRLSGWSEFWMRLPSLAATLGTALLIVRIGGRWWRPAVGRLAAAVFLSTFMITEIGGRLQIDPLLTFLCLLAIELLDRPAPTRGRRVPLVLAAGLAIGIAGLAKGPVALVNVGLVGAAWGWLAPRRERPGVGWLTWTGCALLAVLPMLGWAVLASSVEPGLAGELFFGQHVGRITHADRHPGPPWKHLLRLPMLLLPWTGAVLGGLVAGLRAVPGRSRPSRDPELARAALWFAALVIFFSVIPPKRDLYLLLAYPAAALLGAVFLDRRIRAGGASPWVTLPGPVALLAVGSGLALAPLAVDLLPGLGWRGPLVGAVIAAGAVWTLVRLRRRGLGAWADGLLASWLAFGVLAALVIAPVVNPLKSTRRVAEAIAARPERPTEIPCIGVRPEGFRFYGDGRVPAVPGDDPDLAEALERDGADLLALVLLERWKALEPALGDRLRTISEHRVGGKSFVLLGAVDGQGDR
ncbi:MAG: glycosyltransferase family 39 protein [Thermoanaerobaculales bacterium]|nr:glycosyltransferase family 39 protein [Thermoanaerobaculales bacterium]